MFRLFAFLCSLMGLLATWDLPTVAHAQDPDAEARVFFTRGNEAMARARRARGARRVTLLQEALAAYEETLQRVRSRNALFNAGAASVELAEWTRAHDYFREFLDIEALSPEDRAEGEQQLAAVAGHVGVVTVHSSPPGAEVFVDRLDLAPRGRTPLVLAVAPGEHAVHLRLAHHEGQRVPMTLQGGETRDVAVSLVAEPVAVTFDTLGVEGASLEVDGEDIAATTAMLAPGEHVATLRTPGRAPVAHRFHVAPGQPLRVRLDASGAPVLPAVLSVHSAMEDASPGRSTPVRVYLGEVEIGQGPDVRVEVPPGSYALTVRARGHVAYEGQVTLRAGQHAEMRVTLRAVPGRRLGVIPHIAAAATGASLISFGALAIRALRRGNDFEDQCPSDVRVCNELYDDVRSANTQADVLLAVTGALAVSTLTLYLLNGRPEVESEGELHLSVGPGTVSLGGSF